MKPLRPVLVAALTTALVGVGAGAAFGWGNVTSTSGSSAGDPAVDLYAYDCQSGDPHDLGGPGVVLTRVRGISTIGTGSAVLVQKSPGTVVAAFAEPIALPTSSPGFSGDIRLSAERPVALQVAVLIGADYWIGYHDTMAAANAWTHLDINAQPLQWYDNSTQTPGEEQTLAQFLAGQGSGASSLQFVIGGGDLSCTGQPGVRSYFDNIQLQAGGNSQTIDYESNLTCAGKPVTANMLGGQAPTAASDVILGTAGNDVINAGGGDDTICGGNGNDTVNGGTGSDLVRGDGGVDTASYATAPNPVVVSLNTTAAQATGYGTDTVQSVENLTGSVHADRLTGNGAANVIRGGAGADRLTDLGGSDQLIGGDGNDVLTGAAGNDRLDGGAGVDEATYATQSARVVLSLALTSAQANGTVNGSDTLIGLERLTGTNLADRLTGNGLANLLRGLGGNDALIGNGGSDTCDGGAGTDTASNCETRISIP